MKKRVKNLLFRAIKLTYLKLFRANDSPHKVAFGFGLGVFLGILPGTGPVAALVMAMFFRVNRAAAVLGALLTNTWTSLVTVIFSIKIGAAILGLKWTELYVKWQDLLTDFHWRNLFSFSFLKIALPVLTGYFVISLILGVIAYLAVLLILSGKRKQGRGKFK